MANTDMVTVKRNGTTIVCRVEQVPQVMAQLGATVVGAAPVFEKSAVIKKAIKDIKAETPEELVSLSLKGRKGLHTVISGLNDEIRSRWPGKNPIAVTSGMIEAKLIKGHPAKKGFWIEPV